MSDKLQIVYEPKGKAREYAELACNLYTSCVHGCKYCYVPGAVRKSREEFCGGGVMVKDALKRFAHDAALLACDQRDILFSFTCDPYQSDESAALMEEVYKIAAANDLKLSVLTKAGFRAVRHLPYFELYGWKFGTTVCFMDEKLREEWEPGAPSIHSRLMAISEAHRRGIYTWVSVEPVIDPDEALRVMWVFKNAVDLWKIGKINHFPEIEKKYDWVDFRERVKARLEEFGANYYLKKSLTELLPQAEAEGPGKQPRT